MAEFLSKIRLASAKIWHNFNYFRYKSLQKKSIEEARHYLNDLKRNNPQERRFSLPLNTLANDRFIFDDEWKAICREFGCDEIEISNRKCWEYVHSIYGLKKMGMLDEKNTVLGVASGHEAPLYYLANKCRHVIGTDIYEGSFAIEKDGEANPDILIDADKFAPFPYRKDRLSFRKMDALNLKFQDNSFDIVICLSSIEHFGGEKNYKQAAREIGRVVKPGGMAVLTTEFALNKVEYDGYFNDRTLFEYIIKPSGLELAEPIDFTINPEMFKYVRILPHDYGLAPHFIIQVGKIIFTSLSLFLQKPR
ncbi:MAG: class I SAM-dependent methyltransferase [Candidatus Eremiobacteraeota bacterium]|nr:class I SAM-dependent methyltransferase [Candidatus Eremiobacteraeota bacterium]